MLDYLWARLRELIPQDWAHLAGVSAMGPLLDALWRHWADFPLSNPVLVVSMLWAADWVAGSWLAWRAHQWRPDRARRSVGKWLFWMAALAVAYCIRSSGLWGMGAVAGGVEAAIMLAEASSVFRNMALLSPSADQAKLLKRYADNLSEKKKEGT